MAIRLQPATLISDEVEVFAAPAFLDPRRSASSRFVTRETFDAEPSAIVGDVPTLAENLLPGAVLGHDNFVHVRGNELSLHQFVNGVSFLDNPHQQFFPGLSPRIFASLNMVTGGFRAEYGNRFGGILDITTLSGAGLNGRGRADMTLGTVATRRGVVDYGGTSGAFGYFVFGGAVHSDRYLNPPEEEELHDSGKGFHGAGQFDYLGEKNSWKLLLTGGGTRFELPNTGEEQTLGRDARRELDSASAILSWQRLASSSTMISLAAYARRVEDDLLPTQDEVTTFADGGRTIRTSGLKADWNWASGAHRMKAGADFARLRLTESLDFDGRDFFEEDEEGHHEEDEIPAAIAFLSAGPVVAAVPGAGISNSGELEEFQFAGSGDGHLLGLYLQDQISPAPNLTIDLGLRYDQIDILERETELSPRVGLAYHFPQSGSVLRISYNRLFTPPPIEYLLLADFLGHPEDGDEAVGGARAYVQDLIDAGWTHALGRRLSLDVGGYWHTGSNAFENSEISNSRLFVPTNFARADAWGGQVGVQLRPDGDRGWNGRLDYTVAQVRFTGPITGGLAGEELEAGEEIPPAFDQRHTASANVQYRFPWRHLQVGAVARYGSGTPTEQEVEVDGVEVETVEYLPGHLTADLIARLNLWDDGDRGLDFELTITNLADNRYRIAEESEATPFQFAPRRVVQGRLSLSF